jgi:hypothetical protein
LEDQEREEAHKTEQTDKPGISSDDEIFEDCSSEIIDEQAYKVSKTLNESENGKYDE